MERLPQFRAIFSTLAKTKLPARLKKEAWEADKALVEIIRGRMETLGPVTLEELTSPTGLDQQTILQSLLALENDGFVFRGKFTPDTRVEEWCERRLLARINRYTLRRLRAEIQPVSTADYMQFLFHWHGMLPTASAEGPESLQRIIGMLEGYEAAAASWERDLLPSRMKDYDHAWLDSLCLSGKVIWGRLRPPVQKPQNGDEQIRSKSIGPVKTSPIMLVNRQNNLFWRQLSNTSLEEKPGLSSNAVKILTMLEEHGASFFGDIQLHTGLLKVQVEEGMKELVAAGYITADSYTGLRALLTPSKITKRRRKKKVAFNMDEAGRWSLLPKVKTVENSSEMIRHYIMVIFRRYGIVFRRITEYEQGSPPWRDLVRVLRTMEAQGEVRGGRFVDGVWGEQFALPEALAELRKVKREKQDNSLISISASDPLNLTGIITPGRRVSGIYTNRILYQNGEPIAVKEGKDIKFLKEVKEDKQWELQNALIQREIPPELRQYL